MNEHLNDPLFERSRLVFEDAAILRLLDARVLVAGCGGVGGFVVEALARAGVGELVLVDHDVVSPSNLNRQIVALHSTLDQPKVDVLKQRVEDINPLCRVDARQTFLAPDDMPALVGEKFDFVVDAIDSLNCKVRLVYEAWHQQVPVVSSMGAGRRVDPRFIRVADLMDTHGCGLARQMRQRLRKLGVGRGIEVVFSEELPKAPGPMEAIEGARGRVVNGTASYMPGLFGLTLAGRVIQRLTASE
ncbi:tRNA A37 threonylcarbamoyladenosine dehydratase [Sulfurivirga caldicuralii]|uniref:tRNA A37 threonylcarbamoyladenosine dehydratase n=1 Tax=Sulfurivirga caldicuralii TaxID=364032 RepID=A0A1N6DM37_9GAMM|nr:tRNA threonylcarbamoyladenosine dehydratase [Sulfurivirga caldicuralii]SIN71889.1 tRNA A37 threonylcarbamoyladenosine dehydratase [Sulfurivirga caldicuralii]